jgi:lupus La protein
MTAAEETKVVENEAKPENGMTVQRQIVRQIEHYFGDFNLPRDKFLLEKVGENEGWVEIDTMLKFQRLSKICSDAEIILKALKDASELMEVDEEAKKIRRKPDIPIPEFNEERKKELQEMTVYVKGFDKEIQELDVLITFFEDYEGVLNVNMRTWLDKKENKRHFKGSVFVTFKNKEFAEKFLALDEVKYKDEVLIRKWQNDYFKEKAEEIAEKRKQKNANKQKAKEAKKATNNDDNEDGDKDKKDEKKDEQDALPKGAVLVLEGLNDVTTRENLKEKLKADFEVEPDSIAFIYYQKGEDTAKLRFKQENAAKELLEKLQKADKFQINDVDVKFKVLEGEEEQTFLDKCVTDMAERKDRNRGHKRRGGFGGGRGGKKHRSR